MSVDAMMRLFLCYLKERKALIFTTGLCALLCFVSFWLYRLPLLAVIYPLSLCFLIVAVAVIFDFRKMRRTHGVLRDICRTEDIFAVELPAPKTLIEGDYQDILCHWKEIDASLRTDAEKHYEDRIHYYTVWAHQIKTPIASMRLHLQNEDSALSCRLSADLLRVEQYVEMVMAFLRLDAEHSDYVIRECDVDVVVKQSVKKFAGEFIHRKLRLEYSPLEFSVISDEKWLSFVVEQILSNALKYTPKGSISVTAEGKILCIRDTGIGIDESDLPRIFENGYTGYNGRMDKKASGIGLYLCKRICDSLGHGLWVQSDLGKGTSVYLDLSQGKIEFE